MYLLGGSLMIFFKQNKLNYDFLGDFLI